MSRDFYNQGANHGANGDHGDSEDFVIGRDGKPLLDRYGRPVRRRPRPQERPQQQLPPERPRQDYAPRQSYEPRPHYEPRRAPYDDVPLQVSQRPSRSSTRAPRPRRRPRRRIGCFSGCSSLLAIVLVLAVVLVLWGDSRLTRVDAFPDQPIANTSGTNWLLVGSDSRQGLSENDIERLGTGGDVGPSRTDTIMVLHIPNMGESTLISIPRDSLMNIPGYGEDKINAAFAYGGPKLLSETVEQATGLRIDHYMEIGMGGLAGVVDAIGGVEICVDQPIQDPLAALDVQPGCQKMDGATALGYVRTRATAQGDIDRVARQRQFFGALVDKVASPGTLLNPIRMTSLLFSGTGAVLVGEGDHLWHLGRMAWAMSRGVNAETVPIGGFMDTYVGNVVIWDGYAAEELFAPLR